MILLFLFLQSFVSLRYLIDKGSEKSLNDEICDTIIKTIVLKCYDWEKGVYLCSYAWSVAGKKVIMVKKVLDVLCCSPTKYYL